MDRLASGAWLERELVTFVAVVMLAGAIAALGLLLVTANGTLDLYNRPLGNDFASFFSAGRLALDGQPAAAYDWGLHFANQRQVHGTDLAFPWSYPPTFLVVVTVLATLPYVWAWLVWQGTSLLVAAAVLSKVLPGPRTLILGIAFPAVLICVGHGQTGFLTAALLGAAVLTLQRSEIAAGLLFGLLAYKPQLGLIVPAVLLAGGHWRAIIAATMTVLVSILLTLLVWGLPVWEAFAASIDVTRRIVLEAGNTGFEKFQSAFAWVRLLGGDIPTAYAAQSVVTLVTIVISVLVWRSEVSLNLKGAALLTGALLSSPYVLDYDFVVLGMAIAFLVAHANTVGFLPWEKTLLAFGWSAPLMARSLAKLAFLPVGLMALAATLTLVAIHSLVERKDITPNAGNQGELSPPDDRSRPPSADLPTSSSRNS